MVYLQTAGFLFRFPEYLTSFYASGVEERMEGVKACKRNAWMRGSHLKISGNLYPSMGKWQLKSNLQVTKHAVSSTHVPL